MKKILLIAGLVFSSGAFASGGFANGNEYTSTTYKGWLTVHCPDTVRTYFCQNNVLSPSWRSKFVTDNKDADRVELLATHEDGSTRDKSSKMKRGTSKRNFNLWIASLLQRPLLDMGTNVISYTLENDDEVIERGTFDVMVHDGGVKSCSSRHVWGTNSDCQGGGSFACSRFFSSAYCD